MIEITGELLRQHVALLEKEVEFQLLRVQEPNVPVAVQPRSCHYIPKKHINIDQ